MEFCDRSVSSSSLDSDLNLSGLDYITVLSKYATQRRY